MAKRESGVGTEIKWLEDKQLFCQRFGYKDKAGRNKVKAIYGKSKGEIAEKRKAWQKELKAGLDMDTAKMTFAQWLEEWLTVCKKNTVATTSFEQYKGIVSKHFANSSIGAVKLKDLTKIGLQTFVNEKSTKMANSSLKVIRAIISNSLRLAVENDVLLKSPAIGLKIPKSKIDEREDIQPFTKDELKRILDALKNNRLHNIVYVAAFTGMRKGELLGLRWQDVDMNKKMIRVRQQAVHNPGTRKMETGRLKTANAYRNIPINEKVITVLKKQKAWQAANKLQCGEAYTDNGIVFTNEIGELLKTVGITKDFQCTVENLGIEYRSFHHLRHTFASIAISAGVNVKAISMTLGHATIAETLDTYGHLLPGDNETVTAAVADFLAGL